MKLTVWTWIVIACAATVAHADPEQEAKAHYTQGQSQYQSGHYLEARAEFIAGFGLSHKPTFVFNAAECARLAGDPEAARADYMRYLQLDPNGKHATLAQARLAALPPPAASPASPEPVSTTAPAPTAVHVAPIASPEVAAERAYHPAEVTGTASLGRVPPPSIWHRKALWFGVGAAVVAATVVVFEVTRHHDAMCTPPGCVVVQ